MSFELGERIKSAMNGWADDGSNADNAIGTAVVILRNGELQFLDEGIKNNEGIKRYLDRDLMTNDNDVIVLFDDGHFEWGYDGDCDFYPADGELNGD